MTEIVITRARHVPWQGRTIAYPKGWRGGVAEDLAAHLCDELGIARRTAAMPTQAHSLLALDSLGGEIEMPERTVQPLAGETDGSDQSDPEDGAPEEGPAEQPTRAVPRRRRI